MFQERFLVKADLDGATFSDDCRTRFLESAFHVMQKIAHNSRHSTLPIPRIVVGF